MQHLVSWFEIPATDFNRAVKFYKTVLSIDVQEMEMMGTKMAMFPHADNVSGAVVQGEGYMPSGDGPLVYLNGGDDLSPMLSRVEKAGGKVVMPKTQISPEIGHFALFI